MENKQTFPEVFPDYHIPDNLKYVLSNTIVTRVVMKQNKNQLIVHTKGEHIMGRKLVNKIAFDLKNELFRGTSLFLVIDDTYELSPVYTLEQLTKDYWDSILYELHRMGQVEYSLFLHCEWGFEGRIMTILLEDSFLARSKAPKLKQYLEEMYSHRSGKRSRWDLTSPTPPSRPSTRRGTTSSTWKSAWSWNRLRRAEAEKGGGEKKQEKEENGQKPARRGGYSSNFFEERARRKEFGGYGRRQKDPDIIYGKDCDGEVVPIEEIVDEIGEVVIRGQIIGLDIREIRRERSIVSFRITDYTDTIVGKVFLKNVQLPDFLEAFEKGRFYKIKGMPRMDTFERDITMSSITGIKPVPDFREKADGQESGEAGGTAPAHGHE